MTAKLGPALWGLITRKERWGLSWRGRLALLLALLAAGFGFALSVYPFLAVSERVDTRLLVVEGWINSYAVHAAAAEMRSHPYELVFSTGGPVSGSGEYTNDFNTAAGVGADRLRGEGIAPELVHTVSTRVIARDRTYSSALALQVWFEKNHLEVSGINVVTEDVHARRTRLLYQKAFGDRVKIGIIAVPNPDYDARQWWRYSEGVRAVIGECIAYVYASWFFRP